MELEIAPPPDRALKLSMRLLAPDGAVVAQNDVPVEPRVRFGLLIPPDVAGGLYTLGAVLYDPATMTDLATKTGAALGEVTQVTVVE